MLFRSVLNADFDPALYERLSNQIIIGPSQDSQFPNHVTQVARQYMARLWSWPASRHDEIIQVYQSSLAFFNSRVAAGGYVDIEHVLYQFLNREHLTEVDRVGVEGTIAPNGVAIRN